MPYKFYSVDQIEEDIAVLYDDDNNKADIPVSNLTQNIKEGDILRFDEEEQIYTIDETQTKREKSVISQRFNNLFKKK